MSGDRDSFILDYYTKAHPEGAGAFDHPPYASLAEAVAGAWLIRESGGRAVRVVKDSQVIYGEEKLNTLMDVISRRGAPPGETPVELAERVIAEEGTIESQTDTTRRLNEAFRKATEDNRRGDKKGGKK